mmetsp:Transcript_434/g.1639  ORF Transcript_434/g.1639 Transcript_434/m.1639 type:complete len:407 (-) Transcript_434:177-1397(-)
MLRFSSNGASLFKNVASAAQYTNCFTTRVAGGVSPFHTMFQKSSSGVKATMAAPNSERLAFLSPLVVSNQHKSSTQISSTLNYTNLFSPTHSNTRQYSISTKKQSKKRYLHQDLISLGVHLGHDKKFESIAARPYILGYRHDFAIFDVRHTMWSLKRSLNFLRQTSFRNCRSLFFHGGLYKMDPAYKIFFMHLAQKEKQMLIDSKWQPGVFTNFHHSCHGLLKQFAREYVRTKAQRRMTMLELFMRVLHFTQSQYLDVVGWRQHQKNMNKFWRFFCFFKTYQYLNSVPDVVVLLNPNNQYTILQELKKFHIPIVSVVDSNNFYSGISYPIWGNDDSPLFALFVFQLYMNAYKLGRHDRYKLLMEKSPRGFFDEKAGRPSSVIPLNYIARKKHAQMKDKVSGRVRIH